MFLFLKQSLFELLIILAMMQVAWFIVPRPFKSLIRGVTRTSTKINRKIIRHVRTHVKKVKVQKEKTARSQQPSHNNVINVKFSNDKKQYARK